MSNKEFDITECFDNLRPIFHSEADFQFELAWEIQKKYTDAKVRLEYPVELDGTRKYIDIYVKNGNNEYFIELKYKTKGLEIKHEGEDYTLTNQSAQNLASYDFLKDVQRVETLGKGYAILLTNDTAYETRDGKDTMYNDFAVNEGREIKQNTPYKWKDAYKENTDDSSRDKHLVFKNDYTIRWKELPNNAYHFKYCLIEVL